MKERRHYLKDSGLKEVEAYVFWCRKGLFRDFQRTCLWEDSCLKNNEKRLSKTETKTESTAASRPARLPIQLFTLPNASSDAPWFFLCVRAIGVDYVWSAWTRADISSRWCEIILSVLHLAGKCRRWKHRLLIQRKFTAKALQTYTVLNKNGQVPVLTFLSFLTL